MGGRIQPLLNAGSEICIVRLTIPEFAVIVRRTGAAKGRGLKLVVLAGRRRSQESPRAQVQVCNNSPRPERVGGEAGKVEGWQKQGWTSVQAGFFFIQPVFGGRGSDLTARGLGAECNAGLGCQRSSVG
jgi:hypothetical protein